jgi:triosephosphate isomerase
MTRRPLIAGNWKMFKTAPEAVALAREIWAEAKNPLSVDVLVAPPFTSLHAVEDVLRGSAILLSGQNMHWETQGAFTGEISADMLKTAGCSHVILGHSERRHIFGETDEAVAKKTKAAHAVDLVPIVCVGETLEERDAGTTEAVVERQVRAALGELSAAQVSLTVIAYEPVWAIGTGKVATTEQAQEVHKAIRERLNAVSRELSQQTRILYGGSVKADNAPGLLSQPDIDGALVGGASLKIDSFMGIVSAARQTA